MATNGSALARFFSSAVYKEIGRTKQSRSASALLKEVDLPFSLSPTMLLREFFDLTFDSLTRLYRNEYIYKNLISRKILLGRHSMNTTTMLTEFRADTSMADVVMLNGTSTVYEIKSEYDSTERLSSQIDAYRQIFDNIFVVTSDSQLDKIQSEVDDDIGLMVLTRRLRFQTVRNSASFKRNVEPSTIFKSLRRDEYTQIIRDYYGQVPDVPSALLYQACMEPFAALPPEYAHDAMVAALKGRGNHLRLHEFVQAVPDSLKALALSCRLNVGEQKNFTDALDQSIEGSLLLA